MSNNILGRPYPSVRALGKQFVKRHSRPLLNNAFTASVLRFLPEYTDVEVVDLFLIVYLSYVACRRASTHLRRSKITKWNVKISSYEGDARMKSVFGHVVDLVNSYCKVSAYCGSVKRGNISGLDRDASVDALQYSLFGEVMRGRYHGVDRSAHDPRYDAFVKAFSVATDDRKKARSICTWVCTRSSDLLGLLHEDIDDETFMSHELHRTTKRQKLRDGTYKSTGVEWKMRMPQASRNVLLNRQTERTMWRHTSVVLAMKDKVYATIDDAAEGLLEVNDTGEFLVQHFLWNMCLVEWIHIEHLSACSGYTAFSRRNTMAFVKRIIGDTVTHNMSHPN